MQQITTDQQAAPFPAGSASFKSIGTSIFAVAVLVSLAVIALFAVSIVIGPILWGIAPNTAALLAGKMLTYFAIANVGVGLIITALSCCCLSSCFSSLGCAVQSKQSRDTLRDAILWPVGLLKQVLQEDSNPRSAT